VKLPAKLVADATARAATAISEALHGKVESGSLGPEQFWTVMEGLLLAAMQTLDAIYYLAAESQPKVFPPQAAILIRSLLENLGNVLALSEAPEERFGLYARDSYRSVAEAYSWLRERHGEDPAWADTLQRYDTARTEEAKAIGLTDEEAQDPSSLPWWPSSGALAGRSKRNAAFRLAGDRAAVFGQIYDAWYANLSLIAHQRLPGIEKSVLADEPSPQERKDLASDILTSACFFLACILTEVQSLAALPASAQLQEAWVYVEGRSNEMRAVCNTRYKRLLEERHEPA
jgi:hypothetical protein